MLAIFLNVGRFSDNQNNITRNITFIGEHYDSTTFPQKNIFTVTLLDGTNQ